MCACPLFGKCGGCKFDFTAADYRDNKSQLLCDIPSTSAPVWTNALRRRADFSFSPMGFGFYAPKSKDIVPVTHCPGLMPEINAALPAIAALPWNTAGGALITLCDNGIDLAVTSPTPYFSADFKAAAEKLNLMRVTWNGKTVCQRATPTVSFGDTSVPYPAGAFLQPGIAGADTLRDMVVSRANGARHVADLFCGLGNFTFVLRADGFDISGTGTARDLFKNPLRVGQLNLYDCVVMDPPRAGADAQCRELAKSNVPRVIYVSCNPETFKRDCHTLTQGGYTLCELIPVDQFVGAAHWELFAVFEKPAHPVAHPCTR